MDQHLKIIGLDADDTLWQNEEFFRLTQDRFEVLLADYVDHRPLHEILLNTERRNLQKYGYGIKGFTLSMIETALEVSNNTVPQTILSDILALGRDMLDHPIHLLDGVAETIPLLAADFRLILITKGDLLHQEQKLARSGLGGYFDEIQIVSEKSTTTYSGIFGKDARQSVMIGNSMKSDIVPALDAGAWTIHIPATYEWALEKADDPIGNSRFFRIQKFEDIPNALEQMQQD